MGATRIPLTRIFTLVALGGSLVLGLDSLRGEPLFCSYELGCEAVTHSDFGNLAGIPLSWLGVGAFSLLFGLSLLPGSRAQMLFRWLGVAAAPAGLVLITVQVFHLHQVCLYCLLVDCSAIAMGVAQLLAWREPAPSPSGTLRALWLAGAALGALSLVAISWMARSDGDQSREVPAAVRQHWVAGQVTVVEVADFECPHCRKLHAVVRQLLREKQSQIHFVRLTAPMPAHEHARDAARAFLCACKHGKGDEMAEALFRTTDLSPESCVKLGAGLGLDAGKLRACMADPNTEQEIDATLRWVQETSPRGLPLLWVQDRMLFGTQTLETLREEVRAAQERMSQGEP